MIIRNPIKFVVPWTKYYTLQPLLGFRLILEWFDWTHYKDKSQKFLVNLSQAYKFLRLIT